MHLRWNACFICLDQSNFADYRIKSSIELGRLIEELELKQPVMEKKNVPSKASAHIQQTKKTAADSAAELTLVTERIESLCQG